jgi:zinc protease
MPTRDRSRATAGAAALPLPQPGEPPLPRVPVPDRTTLDNGLRVVTVPWGSLPQIVVRLVLPAGSGYDPPEFPGTAALLGRLLTEGTETMSAEEFNAQLDRLGAAIDVNVGHDFTEIELFLLSETLDSALPLLAELVTRLALRSREFERVRREALDALAARHDEPGNLADDRAAVLVFGTDHPYGRPALGTAAGLERATREQLRAFHHARFRPAGGFVVAAGDLQSERFGQQLAAVLGGWSGEPLPQQIPAVPELPVGAGQRSDVPWPDAQQAEIRVAGIGMERASPDWITAAVANYILGGSTITGRLGANLREDKGWTYGARSAFSAALQPGGWLAETAVDVEVRDAALREMLSEIERIIEEPVTEEELHRTQEALVLSLPRAFESPGRVASRFVTLEAFGLPTDYWERFPAAVRSVTQDEVLRVARRYFAPRALVQVMVG